MDSISDFESLKTNRCATCINTIFPSFNQTYNFGILNFCVALGIFLKSLWYLLLAWVATSLFGGDAFEAAFLNEFTVCPIYDFSSKSKVILYPFIMIIFGIKTFEFLNRLNDFFEWIYRNYHFPLSIPSILLASSNLSFLISFLIFCPCCTNSSKVILNNFSLTTVAFLYFCLFDRFQFVLL